MPHRDHPLRLQLAHEVHARPFAQVSTPERVVHYAMLTGEGGAAADRAHLAELFRRLGLGDSPPDGNQVIRGFGGVRIKWERHTEFCTWTVYDRSPFETAFAGPPDPEVIPREWLERLPGQRLAAVRLAIVRDNGREDDPAVLDRLFETEFLAGSRVSGGAASVWTDFRVHPDGYSRFWIEDRGLAPQEAGRLVQRVLEIETYRMMGLLGLPMARDIGPRLSEIDAKLAEINQGLRDLGAEGDERVLLETLVGLGAELERTTSATAWRFSATRAYAALVERRVSELREERVEGYQTLQEFADRRLAPALRTVEAISERVEALAERLARAANLLRTRVDISLEEQNQSLLTSMDNRARMQLRLQTTVEGLSVAAISYYVAGLLAYLLKALEDAGAPVDASVLTGLAVPVIVVAAWTAMRRVRRRLERSEADL